MKINVKSIDKKVKPRSSGRGPVTVYLDRKLFGRFQRACGKSSASQVMEQLIGQYVAAKRR